MQMHHRQSTVFHTIRRKKGVSNLPVSNLSLNKYWQKRLSEYLCISPISSRLQRYKAIRQSRLIRRLLSRYKIRRPSRVVIKLCVIQLLLRNKIVRPFSNIFPVSSLDGNNPITDRPVARSGFSSKNGDIISLHNKTRSARVITSASHLALSCKSSKSGNRDTLLIKHKSSKFPSSCFKR